MTTFTPKSAEVDPGITSKRPPRWAESLLRRVLNPRDQESILGDLFEEYREERLSNLGRARANLWYIRQMLSIAFFQAFKGSPRKRLLICLCFLTLAASAWFGFTETALHDETVLYHPGSDVRIVWAIELAVVSFITILYLVFTGYRFLRIGLALGAVTMISSGIGAIGVIIGATQFEGYMLFFGVALILQLALAIFALLFVPDAPDSRIRL